MVRRLQNSCDVTKTYLGPENETATGPSYPQQYLVSVEVANGQTVTNLDLTDVLPSNMQFLSVAYTQIHGVSVPTTAISTPSLSTPGGTLTRRFARVTGRGSQIDASMLFDFYIPQLDSSDNPVLAPGVGLPTTSVDQANSRRPGPLSTRDPAGINTSNTAVDTLTDKSLAIQKMVDDVVHTGPPNAVSPGDTLEYTIQFQISDFFAVQNFVANDLLSDGQALRPELSANTGRAREWTRSGQQRLRAGKRGRHSPKRRFHFSGVPSLGRAHHARLQRSTARWHGESQRRATPLPWSWTHNRDHHVPHRDPKNVHGNPQPRRDCGPGRQDQRWNYSVGRCSR